MATRAHYLTIACRVAARASGVVAAAMALGTAAVGGCGPACTVAEVAPGTRFRVTVLESTGTCNGWLTLVEGEEFEMVAGQVALDPQDCRYTTAAEPPKLSDPSLTLTTCTSIHAATLGARCVARFGECHQSAVMEFRFSKLPDGEEPVDAVFQIDSRLSCGHASSFDDDRDPARVRRPPLLPVGEKALERLLRMGTYAKLALECLPAWLAYRLAALECLAEWLN